MECSKVIMESFVFVFKKLIILTIFSNSEYADIHFCTAIVMTIEKQLQLSMPAGFQIGKLLIQEFLLTYITG